MNKQVTFITIHTFNRQLFIINITSQMDTSIDIGPAHKFLLLSLNVLLSES